ncbi:DUF2521 family protein [Peribacillus frigoritolerans]|uniref:DUF2521 family protein n=1 Tax=Peribacillus frigoritolerans TaxID=450367 RepID=UPI002E20EBB7|nr:DUF2521 family protein [Peribacillus frigoritolerans]
MAVILGLQEMQRERQLKFERRLLRELSIEDMKGRIQRYFGQDLMDVLEEGYFDVAIEAYLLGANYSKFGYYGESEDDVRSRCWKEEKFLVDTLFNFILYWREVTANNAFDEGLFYCCEGFVADWWLDGFKTGEKRYKMKLH